MPFVKLDCGILDSSLWSEPPHTRLTFLTMLAMADAKGLCASTAPGIARRANLDQGEVERALQVLEAPDVSSRTPDNEGRRVQRVDGGYQVLNYAKYRAKDYTASERSKRYRDRHTSRVTTVTKRDATRDVTARTQAEAEAEAKKKGSCSPAVNVPEDFLKWYATYPRKQAKAEALKVWRKLAPDAALVSTMIAAVDRQKKSIEWTKQNGQFIPLPASWLRAGRWEDQPPQGASGAESQSMTRAQRQSNRFFKDSDKTAKSPPSSPPPQPLSGESHE